MKAKLPALAILLGICALVMIILAFTRGSMVRENRLQSHLKFLLVPHPDRPGELMAEGCQKGLTVRNTDLATRYWPITGENLTEGSEVILRKDPFPGAETWIYHWTTDWQLRKDIVVTAEVVRNTSKKE